MNKIQKYLDYLLPNPKCELKYTCDYELLIAIVLSARTTDKRVNEVTNILFSKYGSIEKLNNAPLEKIEEIIKPLGNFRKKTLYIKDITTKIIMNDNKISYNREFLMSMNGVGRKTVNVFLSEFIDEPLIAVDTHVQRVSKRLGLARWDASVLEVEESLMKIFPKDKWAKIHKQLVLFGRYYCKSVKPLCEKCDLKDICMKKKDYDKTN